MNKLAIITSFLGAARNRYMVYQEERPLETKLAMASSIEGIDGVELAYPADFDDLQALKGLLARHNLGIAAVNFRSRRTGMWWRGSFTAASANERQEVVDDLRRAMDAAAELGCHRITTCPLNDGADYPFEMDYIRAHDDAAETFAAACAHNRAIRLCIEYKASDPRARCIFGTAGETVAFCQLVGADNLGVTLDIGHAIYAGERPAQSAALLAKAGRLFYVHLNDNDGRWDWDMLPGAYHLWEYVEFLYTLRKLDYDDDWYGYDVLAKEIDTVETFQATVELTRKLEAITDRIDPARMEQLMAVRNPNAVVRYLYALL
ncbi:MAG TPA: sugar phosphate isomerase/epimerase [Chloroflexi bacterium]|jgi:xylose isomerase|nr:sugar phosphate isomerase/epimerase [Chloroflexota bacterium]